MRSKDTGGAARAARSALQRRQLALLAAANVCRSEDKTIAAKRSIFTAQSVHLALSLTRTMPKLSDVLFKGTVAVLVATTVVGGISVSISMGERFGFHRQQVRPPAAAVAAVTPYLPVLGSSSCHSGRG